MIRIIDKKYIEVIGHYDNPVLCAKLTLLADMFAITHKEGYAKFNIEDEDKLSFIDEKLEFSISDLTGTIWVFNDYPDLSSATYYINFSSNENNYSYLQIGSERIFYENTRVYLDGEGWENEAYRTIIITGGTDATNSTLIAWLESNATQVSSQSNNMFIGNLPITDSFFGSSSVSKICYGNVEIYSKSQASPTLISFTIEGTSYQAEENMTWSQWCSSAYNTDGYRNTGDVIASESLTSAIAYNNVYELPSSAIVDSRSYTLKHYGG